MFLLQNRIILFVFSTYFETHNNVMYRYGKKYARTQVFSQLFGMCLESADEKCFAGEESSRAELYYRRKNELNVFGGRVLSELKRN